MMVLLNTALPLVLKIALISPVCPGITGSFDHSGVVHPQLGCTAVRTRGAVPVFLNLNTYTASGPSGMVPKSLTVVSNEISAWFASWVGGVVTVPWALVLLKASTDTAAINNFFMVSVK